MKTAATARPKHTIPAVCKAMELLRLLAEAQGESTTKALALRLSVPRTTCYRLLHELALRSGLTAKVSVRQGDEAVTVARCESPRAGAVKLRLDATRQAKRRLRKAVP